SFSTSSRLHCCVASRHKSAKEGSSMTARREFLKVGAACAIGLALDWRADAQRRRFIIDSHQHWQDRDDYIQRLVAIYRPRNAMACVLTPMAGMAVVRKAAADHPDVVIPYGRINVDEPRALAEVDAFAAAGFKGIKMHSPRHDW